METYNLAQLTKNMLVKHMGESKDPMADVVKIVSETLRTHLGSGPHDSETIRQGTADIARGVLMAFVILDGCLPMAAVMLLRGVMAAAEATGQDVCTLMTYAIEGIANMNLMSLEDMAMIQSAIEREFMGTGEVLRKMLADRTAPPAPQPPARRLDAVRDPWS